MTKTQTAILTTAQALGYRTEVETRESQTTITAREADSDRVRIAATYIGRRWESGYTTDRFGHVTHQPTVTGLLLFAEVSA